MHISLANEKEFVITYVISRTTEVAYGFKASLNLSRFLVFVADVAVVNFGSE